MEKIVTISITIEDEMEKEVEKTKETKETKTYSQYARFFDESSQYWYKDSEYNLNFLRQQEMYATAKLRKQGYLFLNDVYDMLGLPKSKAGQIVGWIYDPENPTGDNYVDFGLYDVKSRQFVNGYEKVVLLDFNVDGMILDKLN